MFDLWAVALLVFAAGGGVAAVGAIRESQLAAAHKRELDAVHIKLRAAEADISELKTQVKTLMRMVGPSPSMHFNAAGDLTVGGDAIGHDKG